MNRLNDALQYFQEALSLKSNDLPTHLNIAAIYLQKEIYDNAKKHYAFALTLEPNNKEVRYLLDAISEKKRTLSAPTEYVEHLFNQYAKVFDQHLKILNYHAPQLLYDKVISVLDSKKNNLNILDLGCGTGLCGEKFALLAKKLIGIDLSLKMLEVARQKNIYSELKVANIEEAIKLYSDIDLILASDTLVYLGDLVKVFQLCLNALKAQGLFAFTIEKTQHYPFKLQRSARFAHSAKYIEELIQKFSFQTLVYEEVIVRNQHNLPVESYLYVLRKK
jgi:predicted TPR repeat methyltransferase